MNFVATFIHLVNAFLLTAHVHEDILMTDRWLNERFPAEAALEGITTELCLCAVHSNVIWLHPAASAEVVRAISTSHSVDGHVLSCFTCDNFVVIITSFIIWRGRFEGELLIATGTLDDPSSFFDQALCLLLVYALQQFLSKGFSQVVSLHQSVASIADALAKFTCRLLG